MTRQFLSIFLLSSLLGLSPVLGEDGCNLVDNGSGTGLLCVGISDSDLPYLQALGYLEFIEVSDSSITTLITESFGTAYSKNYIFTNNADLTTLETDFLGSEMEVAETLVMRDLPSLEAFDWSYLEKFTGLLQFELSSTGILEIASDIPWSNTVSEINLDANSNLQEIPENVFFHAEGLTSASMLDMNSGLLIRSNAFHLTSQNKPSLALTFLDSGVSAVLEDNAFGNVVGGKLWGKLDITVPDFPEGVFRLMLKAHFDVFSPSLLFSTYGPSQVRDCRGCEIAWLYKDAHIFGMTEYLALVGSGNVVCPLSGPVLESTDQAFIDQMEQCPATDLPWPENFCEGHGSSGSSIDTVTDPYDCTCFYHCNNLDEISGHDCCQPGLAYDPETGTCDWIYNIEGCDG